MADDITLQMHKIMDEVTKEAEEALKKGIAKISKETASKLKSKTASRTRIIFFIAYSCLY